MRSLTEAFTALALALIAAACVGPRAESGLTAQRMSDWHGEYPAAARWLAIAGQPDAIQAVWPAVERARIGVDTPLTTPPVWIAAEMTTLPPETETQVWDEACNLLAQLPGAELEEIADDLRGALGWMDHWREVEERLSGVETTSEGLMAAAFEQPATRDLFAPMLRRRGLEPSQTSADMVGGTMTSGEHMAMHVALVCAVSQMSGPDREAWLEAVERRAPEILP
ncbi:hypothetical protein JXA47_17855 [Candidatus Sumerlaeota bacterium]|nr:hypothetical protein [Candidatus Sumerlaeota bacterium]